MTTAQNYKGGGFTDWHLPDRVELDWMYENRYYLGGALVRAGYSWSSTKDDSYLDDSRVYCRDLSDGDSFWNPFKYMTLIVRAVQSFTP
jgi:hypothetical protein